MQTFNSKNGQIYTETTSSSARSMVSSAWKKRITGRIIDPRAARHVKGADSLQDMALRACCWNVAETLFMPETLAYPGWAYAGKLYRKLKSTDALSFEAWMLFQEAYPSQPELSHHWRLEMHDVVTRWPSIIKCLSTLDTNILTHFCAHGLNLDLAKLISLLELPTLTSLIHTNSPQRQTHPLRGNAIRDWCRAVREKNAFPKLKLLYLSSIPDDQPFDYRTLYHLSSFPALVLVGIERAAPRSLVSKSARYGQWQRLTTTREHQLNTAMHDTKVSLTDKTKGLYRYACKMSEPRWSMDAQNIPDVAVPQASTHSPLPSYVAPEAGQSHSDSVSHPSGAEQPVTLTLSCYAPQNLRSVGSAIWFVRKYSEHNSPEEPPKRILGIPDGQEVDDQGTKKRKIKQAKQYDVGSLLDLFAPPLADGTER